MVVFSGNIPQSDANIFIKKLIANLMFPVEAVEGYRISLSTKKVIIKITENFEKTEGRYTAS